MYTGTSICLDENWNDSPNHLQLFENLNENDPKLQKLQLFPLGFPDPTQFPVSTGLRLSCEGEGNSSTTSASRTMSAYQWIMNTVQVEIEQQRGELDNYVKLQNEQLSRMVRHITQRHTCSLISNLEKSIARKLQEKDVEIGNLNMKNLELVERVKQVAMEAQSWYNKAKQCESLVNMLKMNLQQVMKGIAEQGKEGFGDSEVDDTASCLGSGGDRSLGVKQHSVCMVCKVKEVSILLLPCRHLCACKDCEGFLGYCPVCQVMKTASVEVILC